MLSEPSQRPAEEIVILGGGTSGWMAAAYLSNLFGPTSARRLQITLIESRDIGIIGVGEATIPTMRETLKSVGIGERDFLRRCNGSIKLGIKFQQWHEPPGRGREDVFWNLFGTLPHAWDLPAANFWVRRFGDWPPAHFAETMTLHWALARANKAPKSAAGDEFEKLAAYAYHLDTHLLGAMLRDLAVGRGVRRIEDKVVAVARDERGYVTGLTLQGGDQVTGELFIDCSGFRSLLLQQTLGEPFHGFDGALLCDSAIAISKPWPDDRDSLRSYTTATAHRAGWSWNIPLFSREACGYVYSAKHVTPDQAEREFRDYLGDPGGRLAAQHIKMKVGRVDRFWSKNVIALGLAGGFIEPLESTGIYMVEVGLRELQQYFPTKAMNPRLVETYNRHMRFVYDQTKDFICYHYCMTDREDTAFWRDNKHGLTLSDDLLDLLDLWREKLPSPFDFVPRVFSLTHYTNLMIGHRAWPRNTAASQLLNEGDVESLITFIDHHKAEVVPRAVDHLAWLSNLRKEQGQQALAG